MSLDQLIHSVAEDLGLSDLKLNPHGVCHFTTGSGVSVAIEDAPLEQGAHLYAPVAAVPADGREGFFATLLEAQLFGREVGDGCAFGLDRETGEILLCLRLDLETTDTAHFSSVLTEFVNWADHWFEKLSTHRSGLTEAAGHHDSQELAGHMIRA